MTEFFKTNKRLYIMPMFVLVLGIILSVTLFLIQNNWTSSNTRFEFETKSKNYANTVRNSLEEYIGVLNIIHGIFNNTSTIERKQFSNTISDILKNYPGIHAISWNPLVMNKDRKRYESLAKKDGLLGFKFTERTASGDLILAKERDEYVVVYYIAPLPANRRALGFDIASNPTRFAAIKQAFDSGKPIATNKLTLVQESSTQFGVLILNPLYKKGILVTNEEQRHKHRKGFIVGVLRIDDMISSALKGFTDEGLNLYLFDYTNKRDHSLLSFRPSELISVDKKKRKKLANSKDLLWKDSFEFAGRQWGFEFTPTEYFLDSRKSIIPWTILVGMLLLTGVTVLYLIRKLHYVIEIERRSFLQNQTNQKLTREIKLHKKTEFTLRENQALLNKTGSIAKIGGWEVNLETMTPTWTDEVKKIHGVDEIPPVEEGINFYSPDSKPIIQDAFSKLVEKGESYDLRLKIISANGKSIWIRTIGTPVYDESGNVIKATGVLQDISKEKNIEDKIKASLKEKEILLQEIHHRVKNNMQVISSLINLQSRKIDDDRVKNVLKESHGLYRSPKLNHKYSVKLNHPSISSSIFFI
jgi:PAS domain S-box-containing protein